jgi:hypothetical protein
VDAGVVPEVPPVEFVPPPESSGTRNIIPMTMIITRTTSIPAAIIVFLPGLNPPFFFGFGGFFGGATGAVGIDLGFRGVGESSFGEKRRGIKDLPGVFLFFGAFTRAGGGSSVSSANDRSGCPDASSAASDSRIGSDGIMMAG